jgi:transposase
MTNRTFKSGASRELVSFLPPRVEDYVAKDNAVRAIDAYVEAVDLAQLGFRHADRDAGGVGQPPYDPADLLKLYLYGYLNRVRSSRRLAQEAERNLEAIWLLGGLRPGYRTIANFRKENAVALRVANRDFVLIMRELELVGGAAVGIDGAFFHGDASKASITTRKRLAERLAAVDREIEAYNKELDSNDAAEAARSPGHDDGSKERAEAGSGEVAEKVAALMAKRAQAQADLKRLDESGQTQLSRTDPDARLLAKSGHTVAGYNVQIAVDDKHKLIVASEVVNDGNDKGQLHAMATAAKEAVGAETIEALADTGYYSGTELKACEEDGIIAYVPEPDRAARFEAQGRFGPEDFVYDAAADAYRCPAGEMLLATERCQRDAAGRLLIRYMSRKGVCEACPLRSRCVTEATPRRSVFRWEHEGVIDRHRARMKEAEADRPMRRRSGLVEHPFGTLKCRAGYRHFLVRGFAKVRGEWSLMALSYNLARVIGIVGLDRLVAHFAKRRAEKAARQRRPQTVAAALLSRAWAVLGALWEAIPPKCAFAGLRFTPAA